MDSGHPSHRGKPKGEDYSDREPMLPPAAGQLLI